MLVPGPVGNEDSGLDAESQRGKVISRTEVKNEKYKAMLEAKLAELLSASPNREDIAIEKVSDALDEVQLAGERELTIRTLDRGANLIREIRGGLARFADGSYGICLRCDEEIKPKRLDAVPWAKYCIRCQEAADAHEFAGDLSRRTDDNLLAA